MADKHSAVQYAISQLHARERYKMLQAYYENNGLYDVLYDYLVSVEAETQSLRPLRNPANRAVEFYAANLWPGMLPSALPIKTENDAILDPLALVWRWSNWSHAKQVAARWFARDGDWFCKVVDKRDASGKAVGVYLQNIEAQYVSELDADERGYLTYVRLDIPQTQRKADETEEAYTYTEVWDKATGLFRVWEHDKGVDTLVSSLGTPKRQEAIMDAFGIDFIPITQAKFRDVGDERGASCFLHAIDKIDEANRQATRLAQMLFRYNDALWVLLANGVDIAGRPLPPPTINKNAEGYIELGSSGGKTKMVSLPGNSDLKSLVPAINYDAALAILNAQMDEIERDLPELLYYRLGEQTNLSGKAIRLMLSGAVSKLEEARGSAESALVRLDQMALTIGQNSGLFPKTIGTYEGGAFEHSFEMRQVIPATPDEQALEVKGWVDAGVPLRTALRWIGKTEDDLAAIDSDRATDQAATQTPAEQFLAGLESRV